MKIYEKQIPRKKLFFYQLFPSYNFVYCTPLIFQYAARSVPCSDRCFLLGCIIALQFLRMCSVYLFSLSQRLMKNTILHNTFKTLGINFMLFLDSLIYSTDLLSWQNPSKSFDSLKYTWFKKSFIFSYVKNSFPNRKPENFDYEFY